MNQEPQYGLKKSDQETTDGEQATDKRRGDYGGVGGAFAGGGSRIGRARIG